MLLLIKSNSHISLSHISLLASLQKRIENTSIDNLFLAKSICRLIPSSCPFARKIELFDRLLFTIPPLCKLNPFYDCLMALRFQALSYLAENE